MSIEHAKLERVLRLMKLLTGNCRMTIPEIAERFQTSARSIYRYLDTFREAGFVIKKEGEYYKIDKQSPYFKEISELIHFTDEEAYILKSAIESIDENNLIKQNLKKKLYSVYDYKLIADIVVKTKNKENLHTLIEAIEQNKQVILKGYNSAHANTVTDRRVEPFGFTTNYVQLWAYEPASKQVKLFKISRITTVEILSIDYQYIEFHQKHFIDIFRISGKEKHTIKLKMTVRAANLLMEEYPLSEAFLKKISGNEWLLESDVCEFEGVARFILGLYNDIEIIENDALKNYIGEKIKKMQS